MNTTEWYVLMADDDKDDIALVEEAFRRKEINKPLVGVPSGIDLLHYLHLATYANKWPGLILLDVNMPDKSGLETLAVLKQNHQLKKIPVVMFSTSDSPADIRKSYELGANSYVVKPPTFDKLMTTVENLHAYWRQTVRVVY